jgi:hypothetical protein
VVVRVTGAAAGVASAGVAGTSRSCGCTDVSRPAICRSRVSAESLASEVSLLLSFTVHALTDNIANIASGAPK